MINVKAERQALEEQNKNLMLQLHASQLECQMFKGEEEEIEIADAIRKKLVSKGEREHVFDENEILLGRTDDQTTRRIQNKITFRC